MLRGRKAALVFLCCFIVLGFSSFAFAYNMEFQVLTGSWDGSQPPEDQWTPDGNGLVINIFNDSVALDVTGGAIDYSEIGASATIAGLGSWESDPALPLLETVDIAAMSLYDSGGDWQVLGLSVSGYEDGIPGPTLFAYDLWGFYIGAGSYTSSQLFLLAPIIDTGTALPVPGMYNLIDYNTSAILGEAKLDISIDPTAANPAPVPEPATLLLLGSGLLGLAGFRRKKL